jgi:gliding motility-associated-like protein
MGRFILALLLIYNVVGYSQISIGFTVDTALGCNNLTVQFTDTTNHTGITSRKWDFGDLSTDTGVVVSHTYTEVGIYTAELTLTSLTDTAKVSKIITVRQKPVVDFVSSKYANYTLTDTLYFSFSKIYHKSISSIDTLSYNYTWILDTDTLADTTSAVVKQYKKAGKYNTSLIVSAFSACADTLQKELEIVEKNFLPNIFTPNGDGQNDIFYAQTDGITPYELIIFSRYGTIVYKSKGTKVWWDGRTSAGEEVVPGTYYYVLKPQDGDVLQKGTVFLSR